MDDSGQRMLRLHDSPQAALGEALADATRALAAAGVETPAREARLLAAHELRQPVSPLTPNNTPIDRDRFAALVARRAAREPLAYITGQRGFWTLDLATDPETLVPRPDSETLIEATLAALPDRNAVRNILDLGTGTGCLLLATLLEFPQAFGIGLDLSPESASLAARNARTNGLASRAAFIAADWGTAIDARFDLILCNPPYIATEELAALSPELAFEPRRALDGGASGLECYARLIPDLPRLLRPKAFAVLELGAGQAEHVSEMAELAGLTRMAARPDLAGIQRALVLRSEQG